LLSEPGDEFEGGEFVLTEQPRGGNRGPKLFLSGAATRLFL
jgi:hypothetical protein